MHFLPEVCLGRRNNRLCFGDFRNILAGLCLGPRNNPLNVGNEPDYDPDSGSGLRSIFRRRLAVYD